MPQVLARAGDKAGCHGESQAGTGAEGLDWVSVLYSYCISGICPGESLPLAGILPALRTSRNYLSRRALC